MDVIGSLILLVSLFTLGIGYLMSVYSGFRHHFVWGLLMIFFPPITQIIFVLRHQVEAKKWSKLFFYSFVAFIAGSFIVSYPNIGFLVIPLGIGAIVYKIRYKSKTLPGFGWLSGLGVQKVISDGIEFDPERYIELAKRYEQLLNKWRGTSRVSVAQKVFANQDVIHDIKRFNSKYFSQMLERGVNWTDERIQLFLDVMRQKYKLNDRIIIALLLYINSEMKYQSYFDSFWETKSQDYWDIMREVVLFDIYSETKPNFNNIRRLLIDRGIPKKQTKRMERDYEIIKNRLKVSQFARSLEKDDDTPYVGVEKQIKNEIQLAAINSRINSLLDISPENYYIVERDYSRDSRIDNYYRKHFSYVLSRAFDGHCCKCGEGMGQLEFDHFWLPKSKGGNFLMRSKTGLYVNNCIPLCRSCNSRKGQRDFREFFTENEIEDIVKRSKSIEPYINEHMVDFEDPDFPNRAY